MPANVFIPSATAKIQDACLDRDHANAKQILLLLEPDGKETQAQ